MKNEMNVMQMDERQRLYWMMANRFTLIIVGLVWVGMICYDALYYHQVSYFLIVMVPVFAVVRFLAYKVYAHRG